MCILIHKYKNLLSTFVEAVADDDNWSNNAKQPASLVEEEYIP